MPLVGENRTIVKEGLATLQDTLRPVCRPCWKMQAMQTACHGGNRQLWLAPA